MRSHTEVGTGPRAGRSWRGILDKQGSPTRMVSEPEVGTTFLVVISPLNMSIATNLILEGKRRQYANTDQPLPGRSSGLKG